MAGKTHANECALRLALKNTTKTYRRRYMHSKVIIRFVVRFVRGPFVTFAKSFLHLDVCSVHGETVCYATDRSK